MMVLADYSALEADAVIEIAVNDVTNIFLANNRASRVVALMVGGG